MQELHYPASEDAVVQEPQLTYLWELQQLLNFNGSHHDIGAIMSAVCIQWTTATVRVRSVTGTAEGEAGRPGGGASVCCFWVLLADGRPCSAVPVEALEVLGGTTRAERADGGGDEFGAVAVVLSPDGSGDDAAEDAGGLARL